MKRRDWKDPFSWFNWFHQVKSDPVFLYRPEGGRTGMLGETFSRADATTCARYRDINGLWQTAAANVLRDAHYHYDGTQNVVTVLREGASTNSALGACSFADDTYWNASASWTIAAATSCISGQTAYRLTNDNGATFRARAQVIGTFVNGQTDCLSVLVENVSATITDLQIYDVSVGNVHTIRFTWATGLTATTSGTGTSGASSLGTGPNGGALYRIWITVTGTATGAGAAGNQRRNYIYATGTTQNGNAVTIHHAQFEAATSYPSSPIVTVASAVTRAADVWSFAWNRNPEAGTWYVSLYDLGGSLARGVPLAVGHITAANAGVVISSTSASTPVITEYDGSSSVSSGNLAGPSYGQLAEYRPIIASTGVVSFGLSKNSAAESVSTASGALALPAAFIPAQLTIGSYFTAANQYNCAIRSIVYVPGPEQSMANLRLIARS